MQSKGQTTLAGWLRNWIVASVAFVLFALSYSVNGEGQLPPPPPCGGPSQPPCPPAVTATPGRFDGPGVFDITIIVINASLNRISPVTCDYGVTISLVGSPSMFFDQENTPARIRIPQGTPQGIVSCTVTTSAGTFAFDILVGPPDVKGPPPPPPPASVAQFDANSNLRIDDAELFIAIDQWVAGQISDGLFFDVIDAWVSQTSIRGTSLTSPKSIALAIYSTRGFITFTVRGQDIAGMTVEVFDLGGRRVFVQETTSTQLRWNLKSKDGKTLANGVYLYMVTVRGYDNQLIRSEVKKLVVLR